MKVVYDDKVFDRMFSEIDDLKGNYNEIANDVINFYIDSFNNQGFTDYSFVAWDKSKKDAGATLVLTGNLRNSIHVISITDNGFTIQSDTPYSSIHNDGGTIPITTDMRNFFKAMGMKTGNKKWFKYANTKKTDITIPQRTFMDKSEVLNGEIIEYIMEYF